NAWFNKSIDLGCGETLSYEQMLKRTARYLKLNRLFISVPIHSTHFSKLWVSIFGSASIELTSPLIDSLKHPIVPKLENMKSLGSYKSESFEDLLDHALSTHKLPSLEKIQTPMLEN